MRFGHARLPARFGTVHKLTVSGTSAATGAFANGTRVVRVCASVPVHVVLGANPTATSNDSYLPANVVEFIEITAGDKLAVIQASGGGLCTVTEMSNI